MTIQEDIQKAITKEEMYSIGESVPADWQLAFDLYMQLAKAGDAKAQFNLGYMYARGDLMERNFGKAYEWYQKAADSNDPRAHYSLSKMYENGEFVIPNNIKAKEHLQRSIELGNARAKNISALTDAKEALKLGEREKAIALFSSIAANNKEAETGVIACSAIFDTIYTTRIIYSYHSSGKGEKKFWKWGESVLTEVDLTMTNQSLHSWQVLVKALTHEGKGVPDISTIGGLLKAQETQSNIIDPKKFGTSTICGVAIYSDREGSVDKPIYSFRFPDVSIHPRENETKNLPGKIKLAKEEMELHNKTAKPGGCFVLTACYGSYDAPTVLAFRQFRDKHLSQYKLGRRFIAWYYTHGPKWAEAIENKPRVRACFRWVFNRLAKILPR